MEEITTYEYLTKEELMEKLEQQDGIPYGFSSKFTTEELSQLNKYLEEWKDENR